MDPEVVVEFAGVVRIVLRDSIDLEGPGGVDAVEVGKGEMADRAGDFEEGQQDGAAGDQAGKRGLAAIEQRQAEIRRA